MDILNFFLRFRIGALFAVEQKDVRGSHAVARGALVQHFDEVVAKLRAHRSHHLSHFRVVAGVFKWIHHVEYVEVAQISTVDRTVAVRGLLACDGFKGLTAV